MLCSEQFGPKVRNMVMANRRCLLHTLPLLKKRPVKIVQTQMLDQEVLIRFVGKPLLFTGFVGSTWVSWINPVHHWAVGSIHEDVSLCHYSLLHHLPPRHKHGFVSTQANTEHIPVHISKLWMQRRAALLSSMWLLLSGLLSTMGQRWNNMLATHNDLISVWFVFFKLKFKKREREKKKEIYQIQRCRAGSLPLWDKGEAV